MLKFAKLLGDFNWEVLKFVKMGGDFSREVLKFVRWLCVLDMVVE